MSTDLIRVAYVAIQEAAVLWLACLMLLVFACFKWNSLASLRVREWITLVPQADWHANSVCDRRALIGDKKAWQHWLAGSRKGMKNRQSRLPH